MNKVISREYVEKNYIHKDIFIKIQDKIEDYINKNYENINNCLREIQKNKEMKPVYDKLIVTMEGEINAYRNILGLLEETKDENSNTAIMQEQKE